MQETTSRRSLADGGVREAVNLGYNQNGIAVDTRRMAVGISFLTVVFGLFCANVAMTSGSGFAGAFLAYCIGQVLSLFAVGLIITVRSRNARAPGSGPRRSQDDAEPC